MNKFSVFSLASLVIFILLFFTMLSGVSFGKLGRLLIFSMFLFPLLGAFFGLKAQKGVLKWLLIILNVIAVCVIGYLLLLGLSIGER
ncbi:hypothetical protein D1B31_01430 [Neobacillus notoginsengisoli]|uniref:Uncharacterized protein n=1 Tax=Neobacillus notoginsengisoli TaxID=1578198 RepID=A0A417Z017_9BACI|nr:hypothetical protein [Neobacillus notoginsengisoli]RHW43356.1 hypothetical protein D1B31_01430 [Neobacillus notoginsengisoli]